VIDSGVPALTADAVAVQVLPAVLAVAHDPSVLETLQKSDPFVLVRLTICQVIVAGTQE
jgi:hypothetical protein